MRSRAIALISPLVLAPAVLSRQIHRLAEMNTEQIRALDHARTVIIMPGGVLEEHGPYLPSYTDGYYDQSLTRDLAAAIIKRPGWSVVLLPEIPLGSRGANAKIITAAWLRGAVQRARIGRSERLDALKRLATAFF